MNRACVFILLLLPGVSIIVLSILLGWLVFPIVIHGKVVENVRLVEGSDTWNKWKDVPVPVYLSFFIHHVTNPDQVEQGLKPSFQEKGPYVYRQKRKKVSLSQDQGPNTVKYREVVTFHFDRKASGNNTEDDFVNIPNIPFIGIIHTVRKQVPVDLVVGLIGNVILFQEPLIKRDVRVGDLLFEGFDVTKYTNSLLSARLPKEFSGGRFGLYKGKNGSASEQWEVYTGYDNPADFGRIRSWNGKSELGVWQKHSDCDKIRGTDGTIFSPFLTKSSELKVFSPDVCNTFTLEYKKDVEIHGIQGYRFGARSKDFEDTRINLDNRCICVDEDPEKCNHAGVLPLESCRHAPLWSSSPYFLHAGVRYFEESGLSVHPDKEKHETFLDIEPTTGLVLRGHKRLQMNLEVHYERKVRALQHLTKELFLFPLFWIDESAELDEAAASDLKSKLFIPLMILEIVKWVLLGVGVLLLILGVLVFVVKNFGQTSPPQFSQVPRKNNRGSSSSSKEVQQSQNEQRISSSNTQIFNSSSTSISSDERSK